MDWPVALWSHAVGALGFGLLALGLLLWWRARAHSAIFAAACVMTCAWAIGASSSIAAQALEALRSAAWLAVLLMLYGPQRQAWNGFALCALALSVLSLSLPWQFAAIIVRLVLAVLGMLLVELVFRHSDEGERWGIKFTCIGIGAMFAYDFYLYSEAALFQRVNEDISAARGLVNGLSAPLLAASAARNPRWSSGLELSRKLIVQSATIVASACYLLAMAAAGYYLRYAGGDWGQAMQLVFLAGACIVLAGILFSGAARAYARVMISKHFYRGRYDYREEWLRLTHALAQDGADLPERAVQAIAALVDSPGASLWLRPGQPRTRWNMDASLISQELWSDCARHLRIVDTGHESINGPAAWLWVPLVLQGRLYGLLALARPRAALKLNWEIIDVLRIAGQQAASCLAQRDAAESLAIARQFESFHRMSTFVVHDLKNLAAQWTLLLSNARKHGSNAAFQADLLTSLEQSGGKIRHLLARLSRDTLDAPGSPVDIIALARRLASAHGPQLRLTEQAAPMVFAHPERLENVLAHLISNAREASSADAKILLRVRQEAGQVVIEIEDQGCGMSAEFVRDGLFCPFLSTKPGGMGVGAFESREYIDALGGRIDVESQPGRGTLMRVILPEHRHVETETAGH